MLSPDWLTECFKQAKLIEDKAPYTVDISIPKRMTKSVDREEEKDKVVRLNEIMEDVYSLKFKSGNKKRSLKQI